MVLGVPTVSNAELMIRPPTPRQAAETRDEGRRRRRGGVGETETRDERRETRDGDEKRDTETRGERRETRDERREARGERRETRDERRRRESGDGDETEIETEIDVRRRRDGDVAGLCENRIMMSRKRILGQRISGYEIYIVSG